jgi:hypothetical protein
MEREGDAHYYQTATIEFQRSWCVDWAFDRVIAPLSPQCDGRLQHHRNPRLSRGRECGSHQRRHQRKRKGPGLRGATLLGPLDSLACDWQS